MHLLIYGATVPDTFTPEDIADDHMPYGFLYGQHDSGEWMMGIAVLRWEEDCTSDAAPDEDESDADEDDDLGMGFDVPVLSGDPHGLDESALGEAAGEGAPVQYAQAQAAWAALRKLYGDLPAAGLAVIAIGQVLPIAPGEHADVEYH